MVNLLSTINEKIASQFILLDSTPQFSNDIKLIFELDKNFQITNKTPIGILRIDSKYITIEGEQEKIKRIFKLLEESNLNVIIEPLINLMSSLLFMDINSVIIKILEENGLKNARDSIISSYEQAKQCDGSISRDINTSSSKLTSDTFKKDIPQKSEFESRNNGFVG